jgi:hypothetical protein
MSKSVGSRGSGSSELGIPPEISIYSDSGWDSSEPNVLLEECNYNEGQSSNIPHDARASILNTDGQLRDILSDMEPILFVEFHPSFKIRELHFQFLFASFTNLQYSPEASPFAINVS